MDTLNRYIGLRKIFINEKYDALCRGRLLDIKPNHKSQLSRIINDTFKGDNALIIYSDSSLMLKNNGVNCTFLCTKIEDAYNGVLNYSKGTIPTEEILDIIPENHIEYKNTHVLKSFLFVHPKKDITLNGIIGHDSVQAYLDIAERYRHSYSTVEDLYTLSLPLTLNSVENLRVGMMTLTKE